ncbi:MAG: hypothetical protein WCK08_15960, partial [Betaproteobacteria bacterium]
VDITAASLSITAASLGTSTDSLDTSVDNLTLSITGAAYLNEVNALTVASASTGLLSLNTAGATTLTTVTATGAVTVSVSSGDLTVGSMSATGQNVTLSAAGAVLDGDAAVDITAASLSITAASLGTSTDSLDTSVDTVTLSITGAAYLNEANALTVASANTALFSLNTAGATTLTAVAATGKVTVGVSTGSLTVGSLTATGQNVSLSAAGAVLDGDAATDITAATLSISAASLGTSTDSLDTDVGTVTLSITGSAYLNEANALTVASANTGLFSLSTAGATTLTQVNATGAVTVSVSSGDLTVGSLSASGQSVSLSAAGALLDGDADTDIRAQSLSITAASVGSSADALETEVDALSLSLGAGGAFISEADGLTVTGSGIASAGQVSLVSVQGDVQLDAALSFTGTASLDINAVSGAVKQSATSTVRTEQGNVKVLGLTGASVSQVSTVSGQIGVKASEGAFVVPDSPEGVSYGDQPVRIQGTDVSIGAPLSGTGTLELSLSNQSQAIANLNIDTARVVQTVARLSDLPVSAPIVLGNAASGQNAMRLDSTEIGLLADGFERIVIGSQDPTQVLWLGAPKVGGDSQPLVFKDPLVLVASGVAQDANGNKLAAGHVNIGGDLFGQGLTILGSGSTTVLSGGYIRQGGNVLVNDNLVIDGNTTIEVSVAGGVLDLRGSILVKSGVTLTLLASDLRLGSFGHRGDALVLQAGSTLVLGAQSLTVDSDLTIDGGNSGALILRGAVINGQAQDFDLSVQQLDTLATQMVDDSFASLRIGMAGTNTTVRSPSLWSEHVDSLVLGGQQVQLGAAGENAQWQMGSVSHFVAVDGNLRLNADLLSTNGAHISLQAGRGQVLMGADAEIRSPGALVTIKAANGIQVGRIDTSANGELQGAVALDSAAGSIALAGPYSDGMGVRAQSMSFYGYGQPSGASGGDQVLRVESQLLQVSAPSGVSLRALNTNGLLYRLIDADRSYAQLQVVGQSPERVMLAATEVAGLPAQAASQLALGAAPTAGFARQMQQLAWPVAVEPLGSVQARAYLAGSVQALVSVDTLGDKLHQGWILLNDLVAGDEDLLSDLAYGFSEPDAPSFVMGLPGLQSLSSGLLPTQQVLFDYLAAQ